MRVVVLLCCALALAAAAAFVYVPEGLDGALIVAVAMLVCAQVVSLLAARSPREIEDAKLASLAQRISKNSADLDRLSTRWRDQSQKLAELEQRLSARQAREPALPAAEAAPAALPGTQIRQVAAPPRLAQPHLAGNVPAAAVARPAPILCLEPVVRLAEGRTAYYKASLQVPGRGATDVLQPVLSVDVSPPAGSGEGHDLQLLKDVLPVLARLRSRRSAAGVFVPLGAATLASQPHLEAYVALLQANPDEAAGIVLDLNVDALAALDETSLRGLAWLANMGAAFCLTGSGAAQCDLAGLAELGFAFIDMPVSELSPATGQLSPDVESLMQAVTARNMTLIAAGVTDQRRLGGISGAVSLARGPAFAPPRVVRAQSVHMNRNRQVA